MHPISLCLTGISVEHQGLEREHCNIIFLNAFLHHQFLQICEPEEAERKLLVSVEGRLQGKGAK